MAESTKVAVSPLTGSNYSTWKIQCKMALIKENLWGIIDGTDKPPAEDASADRQAKYKARRDKALATIVLNVDPSLLYLLGIPVLSGQSCRNSSRRRPGPTSWCCAADYSR